MIPKRPSAADFDKVEALVYGYSKSRKSSGESAPGTPTVVTSVRIKSPRGLYVSERENQGKPQSVSDLIIECQNHAGGDSLLASQWFEHRGHIYQIKGTLGRDYRYGTTLYQVEVLNDRPVPS